MLYTELLQLWNEAVKLADVKDWQGALAKLDQITEPTSRTLFTSASAYLALGQLESALQALDQTIAKDERLAVGFFQRAAVLMQVDKLEDALSDCVSAQKHMRGNVVIDYKQLGLRYKLYSWQVLYNAAAVYCRMGEWDQARNVILSASQEKGGGRAGIVDAVLDGISRGEVPAPLMVPGGGVFRPRKQDVEQLQQRDFLGKAKVITSIIPNDDFGGFEPLRMQTPGYYEPKVHGANNDSRYMRVRAPYMGQSPGQLTVPGGAMVFVFSEVDRDGMATVIYDGQKGLLPMSLLEPADTKASKGKIKSVPSGIPLPPGFKPPTRPQTRPRTAAPPEGRLPRPAAPPEGRLPRPAAPPEGRLPRPAAPPEGRLPRPAAPPEGRLPRPAAPPEGRLPRPAAPPEGRLPRPAAPPEASPVTQTPPPSYSAVASSPLPSTSSNTSVTSPPPLPPSATPGNASDSTTPQPTGSAAHGGDPVDSVVVKVHFRYTVAVKVPLDTSYRDLKEQISHKLGQPASQLRLRYKQHCSQVLQPLEGDTEPLLLVAEAGRATLWCQTEHSLASRTILYQMVALYDYAADGPGDLEFSEGDTIDILGEVNEEWLEGHCAGNIGIFPSCFAFRENPSVEDAAANPDVQHAATKPNVERSANPPNVEDNTKL